MYILKYKEFKKIYLNHSPLLDSDLVEDQYEFYKDEREKYLTPIPSEYSMYGYLSDINGFYEEVIAEEKRCMMRDAIKIVGRD